MKFTPALGVNAETITIPYTINDSFGQVSNSANITVEVNVPAANPDTSTTPYGTAVTIDAAANDITIAGRSITPSSIDLDPSTPSQDTGITVAGKGTFALLTSGPDAGKVKFTPVSGYLGTLSIPYTIQDSTNQVSNPSTITITVDSPVPPVAANITNPSIPSSAGPTAISSLIATDADMEMPTTRLLGI